VRWRTFELTTRVEVLKTSGTTHVWLPTALISNTPYQKTLTNTFKCDGGTAKTFENKTEALGIVAAEFPSGVEADPYCHKPGYYQKLTFRRRLRRRKRTLQS
jgi:hypothetical protein